MASLIEPLLEPLEPAPKSPLPWHTREEIANITLHSFGLILGLIGFGVLVSVATLSGSIERILSSSIYGVTILMVYLASVMFHTSLAMESRWQKAFEVVDHCAIFLLIAGTYTPFLMVTLKGQTLAWVMLTIIWTLAFSGILYKIFFFYRSDLLSTLAYIAMGWMSLFIAKPLLGIIGWPGLGLLAFGGLMYTIGAVFYLRDHTFRFAHAVWHLFVMAGSICHYATIYWFVIKGA